MRSKRLEQCLPFPTTDTERCCNYNATILHIQCLVTKALEHAFKLEHIMDLTRLRCLGSLFSMLHQACRNVAQYNANHPDFPMQIDQLERYIQVKIVCC